MSLQSTNPFEDRNSHFVIRVRNTPSTSEEVKISSPKSSRKLFNDNDTYSCIPNPKNNSIYLIENSLSGKLLNTQNFMKEDINNKFLPAESSEIYSYDRVYPENCKQKEFYVENARPLAQYLIEGVNSMILAYGPRGAGKSYILRGVDSSESGILPRFVRDVFTLNEASTKSVYISVIQVYKEWVFDLLRGDVDLASTENFGSLNITDMKILDFEQFIKVMGEAITKREVNSNISASLKKKFHLVIRIKLIDESSSIKKIHAMTDFLELAESSFLNHKKNYDPSELEWLNRSFNSLFDLIVKGCSKRTKNLNPEQNSLNNFL